MGSKVQLLFLCLFASGVLANQDPFVWDYRLSAPQVTAGGGVDLEVTFQIPEGHYLYKEKARLELRDGDGLVLEPVGSSPAVERVDPFFGKRMEIFEGGAALRVHLKAPLEIPPGRKELKVLLRYQGCSSSLCYREMVHEIPLQLEVTAAGLDKKKTSLGWKLVGAFLGGLLTDLTPCVLPIIPITLAFIGVRRERKILSNVALSGVLVVSMALTYATLGLLGARLGKSLGFLFQTLPFLFGTSALYLLFALALWGWIPFQLPSSLRNRLARWGGTGATGAVLAGVTVGFLAAPCVGPVVAALLLVVAQSGDLGEGFVLLLAFGLGMGSLFLVIGSSYHLLAGRLRGGALTLWTKRVLACLLFVPAIYYGSVGARQVLERQTPLATPSTSGTWYLDPEEAFREAERTGKPLFIDFFADWCLPCVEMERKTFGDSVVSEFLKEALIPLKVDCTLETPTCSRMIKEYGVIGWPTYLIATPDGRIKGRKVGESPGPVPFLEWLRGTLTASLETQ